MPEWSHIPNPLHPTPAPPAFGKGRVVPEGKGGATLLSRLTLHWLGPFLDVGFSRPLMEDDFWSLPHSRQTDILTQSLGQVFYGRCAPSKRPFHHRDAGQGHLQFPDEQRSNEEGLDSEKGQAHVKMETNGKSKTEEILDSKDRLNDAVHDVKYDESLFKAIFLAFKHRIIWSSVLLLLSDTLRTTTPLVTKVFLTWLVEVYVYHILSSSPTPAAPVSLKTPPRGVGYGIGLAFAIFGMQVCATLMGNHFHLAAMTTAQSTRTALTGLIFRKSLRLRTGRAGVVEDQKNEKGKEQQGQQPEVTTLIAVDLTKLDAFIGIGAHLLSAPIQLILGFGLLIGNLGYSTLAGVGVIVLTSPIQFLLVKVMVSQHRKAVNITDQRVRLTTEVLQGIRLIKAFGWEAFWEHKIGGVREREVRKIKVASIAAALLVAMFTFTPVMAIILTFITYSLTGHKLDVATIFTSLQLFNNIRIPLFLLPMVLSSLADGLVSLARISKFLTAEEMGEPYKIDEAMDGAIKVVSGEFEWELPVGRDRVGEEKKEMEKGKKGDSQSWWRKRKTKVEELPMAVTKIAESQSTEEVRNGEEEERPFRLEDLHLYVPQGALVVIVGPVGSGKSSILQALIGEMRCLKGEVTFGGSIAYVPQVPWIKNATVRDNILFGLEYEEDRFQEVISTCCLERDLAVLMNGEHTEIGEKGVNLSGGQKARVSLARAAYSRSAIVLLDDPLSAVDAYVGKHILENCLLDGPLAKRTRVLVTHALQFLDRADYIYVMDNGKITEQGTFLDLMSASIAFRCLVDEHGRNKDQNPQKYGPDRERGIVHDWSASSGGPTGKLQDTLATLMEVEERNTGAVGWDVYIKYLRNAGGLFWIPIIVTLLALGEAGNVAVALFLGFWTTETIPHFKNGHYMAVYAAIGGSMAIVSFLSTYAFIILCLTAGLSLYKGALAGVLHSPVSFFDTTPMGRISARLTKDQSAIDDQLPFALLQFFTIFATVFGTIGLVFYAFPYLGILFIPLTLLYYAASVFYRRSSVEAKRLDSILRSFLYASYSETLTGLSTIRAYSKQASSIADAERRLDIENRAYYMTIAMQRWLAIRLDFFGNILVLGIVLFGAATSKTVNPAKTSVALTYTLGMTQIFAEIVSLFANCEQEMNAVERVLHYKELPSEGNPPLEAMPPSSWPNDGRIDFNRVKMSYREGLPVVLKGVSFSIRSGEKIGIVGRTGSGKSSLIQVLLRLVELQDGKIEVGGYDISHVSLATLRSRMAFVPQDTTLFLGTLRDNLDPQHTQTDAELISVLQRVWLLPKDNNSVALTNETKFNLDTIVGDEGSNYSAGEKQLLALGRALVKNSRIIILDEATSSVDAETDAKVQRTIRSEFASSTLICIAHRLNTIAHYDRILVMDDGHLAEFDTVINLYDRPESIFRSLCVEANLTRDDILKIRAEHLTD